MKHNLLVEPLLFEFIYFLETNGKSKNTIDSYITAVKNYIDWFSSRFGKKPNQLFSENLADYKEHLNLQKFSAATFNSRMAGLRAWNEYLVSKKIQTEIVIQKNDKKKVQKQYASPAVHT